MDLRDLLTIALNQDISSMVNAANVGVGPDYQLGYMAGMRRAIEILDHRADATPDPWAWLTGKPIPADDRTR